jgi:hypothetical protein
MEATDEEEEEEQGKEVKQEEEVASWEGLTKHAGGKAGCVCIEICTCLTGLGGVGVDVERDGWEAARREGGREKAVAVAAYSI